MNWWGREKWKAVSLDLLFIKTLSSSSSATFWLGLLIPHLPLTCTHLPVQGNLFFISLFLALPRTTFLFSSGQPLEGTRNMTPGFSRAVAGLRSLLTLRHNALRLKPQSPTFITLGLYYGTGDIVPLENSLFLQQLQFPGLGWTSILREFYTLCHPILLHPLPAPWVFWSENSNRFGTLLRTVKVPGGSQDLQRFQRN